MKVGDILKINIDDIGYDGKGISHSDGYTIFTPFVIKDEFLLVKINHIKKNLAFASVIEVLTPSEHRRVSPCSNFEKCGGCNFLHIDYNKQLEYKKEILKNILKKNSGLLLDIDDVVYSNELYYRNKIQLPVRFLNGKVEIGFFKENSHQIVPIDSCILHSEWVELIISTLKDFIKKYKITAYDEKNLCGLLKHIVARNINGNISICLVLNGDSLPYQDVLIEEFKNKFNEFSLFVSINKKHNNVILGEKLIEVYNPKSEVSVMGIKLEINPYSFFQINDEIRDKIYSYLISKIEGSFDILIDAYSGVGLTGAILAKKGLQVVNIEIVPEAIRDANILYEKNGILDSVTNICGDCEKVLPNVLKGLENKKVCLILDPPRKGISENVIESILKNKDKLATIFYLSCNPATLSRDLNLLKDGYQVVKVSPYDMFPNTYHIETLVELRKAEAFSMDN